MNKLRKQELVGNLHEVMRSCAAVIVTKNINISVADVNDLRRRVKQSDGRYCVVKNKLAKIAVQSTCYENLLHLLNGPTALTYSNDPVSISKTLVDFCAKNESVQILGGAMGETYLTSKQVQELASLPSVDESRAKIIGLLNASASKLVSVLQAPMRNVVGVLTAYSKQ